MTSQGELLLCNSGGGEVATNDGLNRPVIMDTTKDTNSAGKKASV